MWRVSGVMLAMLAGLSLPGQAQDDAGFGTFSDLVSDSFSRAAGPPESAVKDIPESSASQPESRVQAQLFSQDIFGIAPRIPTAPTTAKDMVEKENPSPLFQTKLEYDYRFNQQRNGGTGADIHEVHATFAFDTVCQTNFAFQYFHTSLDGSSAVSSTSSRTNGGTFTFTKTFVPKIFAFVLPLSFSEMDTDASTSGSTRSSYTDRYALNPFLRLSSPTLFKHVVLSLAPGYRLTSNNQAYTNVDLADGGGSNGVFNLLARVDYDLAKNVGLNGTVTWNRLTNYETTPSTPRPDTNAFALGAGFSFVPANNVKLDVGYQYDGFNRNSYQHSLSVAGTYKF